MWHVWSLNSSFARFLLERCPLPRAWRDRCGSRYRRPKGQIRRATRLPKRVRRSPTACSGQFFELSGRSRLAGDDAGITLTNLRSTSLFRGPSGSLGEDAVLGCFRHVACCVAAKRLQALGFWPRREERRNAYGSWASSTWPDASPGQQDFDRGWRHGGGGWGFRNGPCQCKLSHCVFFILWWLSCAFWSVVRVKLLPSLPSHGLHDICHTCATGQAHVRVPQHIHKARGWKR